MIDETSLDKKKASTIIISHTFLWDCPFDTGPFKINREGLIHIRYRSSLQTRNVCLDWLAYLGLPVHVHIFAAS
jgi:hypothetical protein